ncbi:hypothetical protein RI138_13750 [Streptomyces sp. C11-1]|uniref:Histone deacetylase n=1 Tax=Streptomyces durocortorensis TaxID=2811104 RepID=A0ABY9VYC1_9ACTN|nr:hypothetical protein [Streptomyces durocortorensis]WNF27801.1 hypothetical protein RI138_13750 [Streptomyces durocortorensis]
MTVVGGFGAAVPDGLRAGRVWYAAYGSNIHLERLAAYVRGGRPPGRDREYPGCRAPAMPAASVPVELDGVMHFVNLPLDRGHLETGT